ncbi:MAG: EAL domain-containing protein [Kofleriaceae bacterium]
MSNDVAPAKAKLGRVLVVDDDPTLRRLCARVLSSEGWEVVIYDHASHAIEAVRDRGEQYDCIVSDVWMPGVTGFDLVAELRRHDDELPVLLMTGEPSLSGAMKAIDMGAVSYLAKPFDHEALAAAVARAARKHGVARMRRRAESYARFSEDRALLSKRLDGALSKLWMAFQPIVDVAGRRVYAYEALLRTDEESLRRPDLVIAAAERLDRIHELGRIVRASVAKVATQAPSDALIFVNVHGLELIDEELFSPSAPLTEFASRVVLEITERIGIDAVAAPARVAMLRRLGFRIAVDDLGAGYAALGALATLEPDIVKLDMSLVRDVDTKPKKRSIMSAIATLCRELGSQVVAEGVETRGEQTTCTGVGVNLLQGYVFAKPSREFSTPAL